MAAPKMEYNFLGNTGVKVSNLCLGTMTFGLPKPGTFSLPINQIPDDTSLKILDKFEELGGNFLDSADIYQAGGSEEIIGKWLSKRDRSNFIIATKCYFPMGQNMNKVGLSRRNIIQACEASLKRLQTPYIDLYQTHLWDNATPIEETLRTLDDLIRADKIRNFGVSNVCGWQMQKIVDTIQMMGLNKCVTLQQQYNLLERHSEFEEFMVCEQNGIGVLPWSPLKGGLLTGKYKKDKKPDVQSGRIGIVHQNERIAVPAAPAWSHYETDQTYWTLMEKLGEVAETHKKSMAQVAIRWLLQKKVVCSVIIGATSTKQLESNVDASSGWELSQKEMETLESASPRPYHYPYDFQGYFGSSRINPFNNSKLP